MENYQLSLAVQFIFAGLTSGSIYALVALGFNMIYNVTRVVNLAQGEFLMLGAMTMISLHAGLKLPMPVALVLSTIIVGCIGVVFDRFIIRPLKKPTLLLLILLTLGASTFLKGVALLIWGKSPYSAPTFVEMKSISFLGASFSPQILWVIGTVVVTSCSLWFFFEKTFIGKAMRACAENPRAASLMGIDVKNFVTISFFLGGAIGGLGGMMIAPISFMVYDGGTMMGLKGFAAAVLGGVGSYPGAVIGGIVLGLLENLATGYISSFFKDTIAFLALLLILFIKPSGLMKRTED
ncbi:MAG: branched-chain amino acid ABC transporter permease [Desulfuromonadaceae bacterium]|nr:branched-chain amino acid ABC transporter permease [Desulfuromonadaceae bacterium]